MIKLFNKNGKDKIEKPKNERLEEIGNYIEKLKFLTSELKEKDAKIYSIQEDYKKIFNLFSDSVLIIDPDGYILDLNIKAQKIFYKFFDGDIIGSN